MESEVYQEAIRRRLEAEAVRQANEQRKADIERRGKK